MRNVFTLDSTAANLGISGAYTGAWVPVDTFNTLNAVAYADVAGTLYLEQSLDGVNAIASTSVPLVAATLNAGLSVNVQAPYARVRLVNGAAAQTVHRTGLTGTRQ